MASLDSKLRGEDLAIVHICCSKCVERLGTTLLYIYDLAKRYLFLFWVIKTFQKMQDFEIFLYHILFFLNSWISARIFLNFFYIAQAECGRVSLNCWVFKHFLSERFSLKVIFHPFSIELYNNMFVWNFTNLFTHLHNINTYNPNITL